MKINLAKAWTYRTPEVTIEYAPGEHDVTAAIGAAYEAEQGASDGDGTAKTGAPRAAGKAQG